MKRRKLKRTEVDEVLKLNDNLIDTVLADTGRIIGLTEALDEASAERNELTARIADLETRLATLGHTLDTERSEQAAALLVALEHNERLRTDLEGQASLHRIREKQIDEIRRQRNDFETEAMSRRTLFDDNARTIDAMRSVGDRMSKYVYVGVQREWEAAKEGRLLRVNGRFVKQS